MRLQKLQTTIERDRATYVIARAEQTNSDRKVLHDARSPIVKGA